MREMQKKKYRYGPEYIRGFDSLDEGTKDAYEFEATLCERVIRTIGLTEGVTFPECPLCGSRVWKVGHYTVNFTVPFTSGWRIVWMDDDIGDFVECVKCGRRVEEKEGR